ncbi:hypothetical protein BDW59DRAFT_161008 [Aspergillus cavernicola]|uniref:F-box domain-containing protein n=1 Tax=Aspergillus cavernicola TaxID=176166 RepID=A0ABR4IFF0_9EURO
MPLQTLPAELLCNIAGHIGSLNTLSALSRVSRKFNAVFDPILYQKDAQSLFIYNPRHTREKKEYSLIPPLVGAVNSGHLHLVQLLVEHGANVNAYYQGLVNTRSILSSEGSPLQLAMDLGHQDIGDHLRVNGAVLQTGAVFDRLMEPFRIRTCTRSPD